VTVIYPTARIQYPMSLEREYAKELVKYVRKVRDICMEHVEHMADAAVWNSIHADDWTEEQTEEVESDITEETAILALILAMFNRVKTFNRRQQERVFRGIFGATPSDISAKDYKKIRDVWINQNIELIHSMDRRTLEAIHYVLSRNTVMAVNREAVVSELKETIQHMTQVNEKRAALIACDQVGKLNSQMTQLEQMNAGVEKYIWSTMEDNRVRPEHRAREGKVFRWDSPPSDGHPGWAVRCRCTAKPIYDENKIGLRPKYGTFKKVGDRQQPHG